MRAFQVLFTAKKHYTVLLRARVLAKEGLPHLVENPR